MKKVYKWTFFMKDKPTRIKTYRYTPSLLAGQSCYCQE